MPRIRSAKATPRWTIKQIVRKLNDADQQFLRWDGYSPDAKRPEELERFRADYLEYERAIGRAIRAGLVDHPKVAAWVSGRRSIGDRGGLRKFGCGFEAGIPRGIDEADLWIASKSADFIEGGMSLEQIRRKLLYLAEAEPCPSSLKPIV